MKSIENIKKGYDKYKNNELFINLIILTILFFLNCFMYEMTFLSFAFLFIIVIMADLANGFTYLVFTIPFCMIGMTTSGFIFIAIFATFTLKGYIKLLFFDKQKIDKKFWIALFIFIIYLLLPFDGKNGYNFHFFVKFVVVVGLLLFAFLMTRYPKEFRIKINVSILAVSVILSIMCFGTYFVSDYLQKITILSYVGDFIRFQALLTNPNILAMTCEISLALLMYFILSEKVSWVEIFSFVVFAVIGFSTFSKTFLILLVTMLTILTLFLLFKKPFYGLCVITSICFIIVLLVALKPQLFVTYFNRFVNTVGGINETDNWEMNNLTTGRYELWISYVQYMLQYPFTLFFGRTLGAVHLSGESPHNIYISSLYQFGIVGVILFISVLVLLCKDFKKNHPLLISKWIIVPILIISMLVCVEDLFMFIYD